MEDLEGGFFSKEDIRLMVKYNEYMSRVTDTKHTYVFRRLDNVSEQQRLKFTRAYGRAHGKIAREVGDRLSEMLRNREISPLEGAKWAARERWKKEAEWAKNNAKKYGYQFSMHNRRNKK